MLSNSHISLLQWIIYYKVSHDVLVDFHIFWARRTIYSSSPMEYSFVLTIYWYHPIGHQYNGTKQIWVTLNTTKKLREATKNVREAIKNPWESIYIWRFSLRFL